MNRAYVLTKHVKNYDPDLFVKRSENGMFILLRKKTRLDQFEFQGVKYLYTKHEPQEILALTDNWTTKGKPVDVGIDKLLARIQQLDGWSRENFIDERIKGYEELHDQEKKARENEWEAKAYEARDHIKKIAEDYNLSSLDKTDFRKQLEKKGKTQCL